MVSSGMLRFVALVRTDVPKELSASFIRVTRIGELITTLPVTSDRRTLRRNTKEALSSSETSVLTRAIRRNIQEDTILHLKSYRPQEKLYLGISEQKGLNTTGQNNLSERADISLVARNFRNFLFSFPRCIAPLEISTKECKSVQGMDGGLLGEDTKSQDCRYKHKTNSQNADVCPAWDSNPGS
jgi:hypothetical protein